MNTSAFEWADVRGGRVAIRHDHAPDYAWADVGAWLEGARREFSVVGATATVVWWASRRPGPRPGQRSPGPPGSTQGFPGGAELRRADMTYPSVLAI